jgi:hypothetical protein
MLNNQKTVAVVSVDHLKRDTVRFSAMTLITFIAFIALAASTAMAADNLSGANARYAAERAVCTSGESNQDRATCLKEAQAAQQESKIKNSRSGEAQPQYRQNALVRCDALPADERLACQRRIDGEGTTSGNVRDGGLMRELVVPDTK